MEHSSPSMETVADMACSDVRSASR